MKANTKTIQELLTECETMARKEGWQGEWEPTAPDLEWICDQLGRKPTREEWTDAGREWGIKWIGDAHVSKDVE